VTQPTLVINSEQDNRIPRKLALGALERIRAPVEQHWVGGCGHVITVDYCKDTVADLVVAFLARHAG
jgi:esterase/lipase